MPAENARREAAAATPVLVSLRARARDRDDAIRQAAAALADGGFCPPGYVDSLLGREATATTYLGQGLAIPHGRLEDKGQVRRTGLAVLQLAEPVAWGAADKPVRLVVAVAAASDEHITVLRRLARLMRDDARLQRLASTDDAALIVRALTADDDGATGTAAGSAAALQDFDERLELTLDYPHGLHARPAGEWARLAGRLAQGGQAELRVSHEGQVVDASQMAALLSLGAGRGATLRLSARGPQAAAALRALRDLIARLGQEECRQAEQAAARQSQAQGLGRLLGDWEPAARRVLHGVAASPGLVAGTVVLCREQGLQVDDRAGSLGEEARALDAALEQAARQLETLAADAKAHGRGEQAGIFVAHGLLLQDVELLRDVGRLIVEGHGAAWAWRQCLTQRVGAQRALADATLAARAADLQDVGDRVLRLLLGHDGAGAAPAAWPADTVLLADDLAPSVTAQIDVQRVRGFATARGGPTAHTAILARALGLPALVAAGAGVLAAQEGERVIVDGYRGRLYLGPSDEALAQAQQMVERLARHQAEEARSRLLPATTTDGHTLEIAANVNRADQVARALDAGAEGVGLMRTEFLFLEREHVPDEQEQYIAYRDMVRALGGRPLIVRTLDIGGDKQVPHLALPVEENPFLGVRGARLCLRRDELLLPQLRALVRAAAEGPLAIMFPMISTVDEVRQLRERLDAVRRELGAEDRPISVGIMIEVPSAALLADRLAAHVDFFSIGTNDLTQYTLAVDRQHPELAGMADSLHPAVLRLIAHTVAGARRHGRWVGVCGGLAGEPLGAALLAGLGVQELSMSTGDIAGVKALLRRHRLGELRALADDALEAVDGDAVRALGRRLRSGDAATSEPGEDAVCDRPACEVQ